MGGGGPFRISQSSLAPIKRPDESTCAGQMGRGRRFLPNYECGVVRGGVGYEDMPSPGLFLSFHCLVARTTLGCKKQKLLTKIFGGNELKKKKKSCDIVFKLLAV